MDQISTIFTMICVKDHTSANVTALKDDVDENNVTYWLMAPSEGDTLLVLGNGVMNTRSNAMKVDWVGNQYLGGNVYVNCDSDSTNGTLLATVDDVASAITNIPIAGVGQLGVVSVTAGVGGGINVNPSGGLIISKASSSDIKGGSGSYKPIVAGTQHEAVFYGLAKAAGDTTQSNSDNTVGTYTTEAKAAIRSMIGVESGASYIQQMSGTDITITGEANVRYMCGELYSLTITPPSIGSIDVIFTSGSTPTVLTLPNTVKFPEWWDGVETNQTYEIVITDGVYAGVMSWAV